MTSFGSQDLAGLRVRIDAARASEMGGAESLLEVVDEIVTTLAEQAGWSGAGCALAALGGYGRAELSPRSDVDLLFLHRKGSSPPPLEPVLYPLWDLGFDVGHALRTPSDCGRMAAEDLTAATALLDARLLLGDLDLLEEARRQAGILAGSRRLRSWLPRLARDVESRRARFGEISHLLEPHLKEGRGGLRDYQASRWALACLGADRETVSALTEGDAREAYDFLLEARSALHRVARRKTDHLTFDFHREVALEVLPDASLGDFFGLLHRASHRVSGAWAAVSALALAPPKRWILGRSSDSALAGPALGRELRSWAGTARPLPLRLRRSLSEGKPEEVAPQVSATVAGILRAREALAPFLTELHELELLGLVLPELDKVIHQVHYDASHAFTTGVHCIETLRSFEELWLGLLEKEETHLTRLAGGILRPWTARLAALCHDLGKAHGTAEHARSGAAIARAVALRLGFTPEEAEETAGLVEAHDALPAIAFGRDLDDPAAWEDARRVAGTPQALDALVALAFADLTATHPGNTGVWSGWRRDLLLTLAARTSRAEDEEASGARRHRVKSALAESGASKLLASFDDLWPRMPVRQGSQMPADLVAQLLSLATELGDAPAVWRATTPGEGLMEILGVAYASPRLLSSTLGALTSLGLDLLSVQVHTWPDGTVHLWLRATAAGNAKPVREVVQRLTRRLSEESSARPSSPGLPNPRAQAIPVDVNVRLLDEGGPFYTALHVRCRDRKGLLRDLASCFERLGLTVIYALVTTVGPIAQDVFHLQDVFGGRVEGQEKRRTLLQAVEEVARGGALTPD